MRLRNCLNVRDLGRAAESRLPRMVFAYLEGGADDEVTLARNRAAFDAVGLVPNCVTGVEDVDTRVTVVGTQLSWPMVIAPTGLTRLFHREGELAIARAAGRTSTAFALSTMASYSLEDVAAVSSGPKWFQLYAFRDARINTELLDRAKAAGYTVLLITVDAPVNGRRERDLRNGLSIPIRLNRQVLIDIATHPRWLLDYMGGPPLALANISGRMELPGASISQLKEYVGRQLAPSFTWPQLERIFREWGGPVVIKGISQADDARAAVRAGARGIVVSNHGGRQLDGAAPTLDCLPAIADAVHGEVDILVDGGIHRGTHIVKAIAMGASAVLSGRACLYGLAAAGEKGVSVALGMLRTELERSMRLLGVGRLGDIEPRHLMKSSL